MEIDRERFVTLCQDAEIQPYPFYSGRGMYEKNCVGIVGSANDLMKFTLQIVPQLDREWNADGGEEINGYATVTGVQHSDEWLQVSWDSFGLNQVFYWPCIQASEGDDTEGNE